ncbi:DNA-3-methyladenine glycosylase [Candidatus Dependentiae bacterium]|nr:DNA-3-methyladenine glycosylase [Candidatus Dependentiae bacterium]
MKRNFTVLSPEFYDRDTLIVARELLGKLLVRVIDGTYLVGIITETEAYTDDAASHAHTGQTDRNSPMFGPVGRSYVYFTYGIHYCLNVVARETATCVAGAVLIRALMPVEGQETMLSNRKGKSPLKLDGPGRLTKAYAVTNKSNNLDLTQDTGELFIADGYHIQDINVSLSPRIGISQAKDNLWRFAITQEGQKLLSSQII